MGIPTLSSEQRKGACGFLPIPSKGMGTCRLRSMANSHRQEKLGELIAVELSDLLRTRVKDPRVGFASITHVEVSGDFRHAKVFVSVMGSPEEREATMQGLKNATGFLRHELATRLVVRYMPEIVFKLDKSIEEGARILELIQKVEQEDRQRSQKSL